MSEKLEFTGERFTPECEREIWYEHLHRYAFARPFCEGKKVLDAACGEGYGSSLLASVAGSVLGMDVSSEAVSHASNRYGDARNLEFKTGDCASIPFEDDEFDVIVSFETLEHLDQQDAMLTEFRRVLTSDGLLVISSPDKAVYTEQMGIDNEYHVAELYRDEFEALVGKYFPSFELLGQKLLFHSAIWPFAEAEGVSLNQYQDGAVHSSARVAQPAMYLIALCAADKEHLPKNLGQLNLFDDHAESVYQHYFGEIRRNMAAGGIIAERDQEIARLKSLLEEVNRPRSWLSRLLSGK